MSEQRKHGSTIRGDAMHDDGSRVIGNINSCRRIELSVSPPASKQLGGKL